MTQLLQRPPPANPTTQQQQLLGDCFLKLHQLQQALTGVSASAAAAGQQLSSILSLKSAHNAALLIVWALQRPALLQVDDAQTPVAITDPLSRVCFGAFDALLAQLASLKALDDSSAAQLAMEITQQLEQSGERIEASRMMRAR